MARKRMIRIGFDLDGVIIDKPLFIPKNLIEWLFKGGQRGLHYRFPKSKIEQLIRKLSHFYLFRPPLSENIAFVKEVYQQKNFNFYLISSRYSFLEKETRLWLRKKEIEGLFEEVYFNLENQQPHFFKEERLRELGLDAYFEDDQLIAGYLRDKVKKTKICLIDDLGKKGLIKKFFRKYL